MNERILEYAEQARLYAKSVFPHSIDDPTGWNYEYHKKFAELIVAECVAQCWTVSEIEHKGNVLSECSKRMRKYFGVEE